MTSSRSLLATLLTLGTLSTLASADIRHRWSFDDQSDSVGGATLTLHGGATLLNGQLELPGGGVRTNYGSVNIGSTISSLSSMTVESWFTLDALTNWSKVWMFGIPSADATARAFVDFTPFTGLAGNFPKIDYDPPTGVELNTAGGTNPAALTLGTYYVASVYDASTDTMSFYINGVLADSGSMGGGTIGQLGVTTENFFGAAVFFNDQDLDGRIDEMRIWDTALTGAQISENAALGPNQVPEPATGMLALASCALLGLRRRRS